MTPWDLAGLTRSVFVGLPLSARVAVCAMPYLGWGYDSKHPSVAYPSGSVPDCVVYAGRAGQFEDHEKTDCSTQATSILMACYPDAPWDWLAYTELQLFCEPFVSDSPIEAVRRMGIGYRVDRFYVGSWHLVQGWREANPPAGGGHLFLVYAEATFLQVLEATGTSKGGIGPQFSQKREEDMHARYTLLHIARLQDG